MGEVPEWPPRHSFTTDQQSAEQLSSIVVRNTFIDVRRPEESDEEDSPCMSPHRRNLSAPPSPSRRGRGNEWNKESDEEEDDPGSVPHYHWRPDQNLLGPQTPGGAGDWPDQYIEDDPSPPKFWHELPHRGSRFGNDDGETGPPGLLLPQGGQQRDGKSSRKGRQQDNRDGLGNKGAASQQPPLGSYLRSPLDGPSGGDSFMSGISDFSYASGFAGSGLDNRGLGMEKGSQQPRGREGFPMGKGGLSEPGNSFNPALKLGPGVMGGFGGFGQDIWSSSGKGWEGNEAKDIRGFGAPPFEQPFGGAVPQNSGQSGNRKQRRGQNQWPGSEEMPAFEIASGTGSTGRGFQQDRRSSGGKGNLQPPSGNLAAQRGNFPNGFMADDNFSGGGLGIAAGANAVGPVVGAGRERGPLLATGSMPNNGRGKDPLAVGSAAVGPTSVTPFGMGNFPTSGQGNDFVAGENLHGGSPFGGPGAAPFSSSTRGDPGSSTGRFFGGADGPWIPEGVDLSALNAMVGGRGRGGGGYDGGRGSRNDKGNPNRPMALSGGGPKRTDYIKKYGSAAGEDGNGAVPITTMMLKNIPCRKSQDEVMAHVDKKGFAHRYDFFYIPRDVKFRANLGYAFINFVTPEDAAAFQAELNGYRFANSGSSKACAVVPAHVQGLMNNLAAFKRTEVMRSSRKPFFSEATGM